MEQSPPNCKQAVLCLLIANMEALNLLVLAVGLCLVFPMSMWELGLAELKSSLFRGMVHNQLCHSAWLAAI